MRPGKISIGDYNDRVSITQQGVGDRDSIGGTQTNYFTPFTEWANVIEKNTPYKEENGAIRYVREFEIRLRVPVDLNQGDLITKDGVQMVVLNSLRYDKTKTLITARGQ